MDDELPVQNRADDSERRANEGKNDRLAEQQAPDGGHRIARGAKNPDLSQPLLDSQLEEEDGQHQRRDHQKEAEVGEVLAEVGGTARRVEGRCTRGIERYSHRAWGERAPQALAKAGCDCFGARAVKVDHAKRRQRAVSRPPQIATALVGNEGFRRRSVLLPVPFVFRPDARQIDRKWRIPIRQTLRARDTRIVRRKTSVGREASDWDDSGHRELRGARDEAGGRVPQVVVDVDPIARHCLELARRPSIQHNRVRARNGRHDSLRRWASDTSARAGRAVYGSGTCPRSVAVTSEYGNLPIALADRVGEIGKNGNRLQSQLVNDTTRGSFEGFADDAVRALDSDGGVTQNRGHTHAKILEPQRRSELRVGPLPA